MLEGWFYPRGKRLVTEFEAQGFVAGTVGPGAWRGSGTFCGRE